MLEKLPAMEKAPKLEERPLVNKRQVVPSDIAGILYSEQAHCQSSIEQATHEEERAERHDDRSVRKQG
jgi:hypothetical protein